jgi:hypothetical protein
MKLELVLVQEAILSFIAELSGFKGNDVISIKFQNLFAKINSRKKNFSQETFKTILSIMAQTQDHIKKGPVQVAIIRKNLNQILTILKNA